jgi:3-deoxy-manno-octulosonate cytidylyltransferase (CMP-KDO synthetase)
MSFTAVIPARFASTRLPGKPLVDIGGRSMVERVYACASASSAARVVVATDDERIVAAVQKFGGEVCLTSTEHQSGTDRLEEVARQLRLADDEIVVNVQGDEPLIPPRVIDQVAVNLTEHLTASCATLSEPVKHLRDAFNPNVVKVVTNSAGFALYFSRAPIPWDRDAYNLDLPPEEVALAHPLTQRHIGIYAYRVALLREFVHWPMASLEAAERLEQLRILANGRQIHVAQALEEVPGGVDTPEDLERVRGQFTEG